MVASITLLCSSMLLVFASVFGIPDQGFSSSLDAGSPVFLEAIEFSDSGQTDAIQSLSEMLDHSRAYSTPVWHELTVYQPVVEFDLGSITSENPCTLVLCTADSKIACTDAEGCVITTNGKWGGTCDGKTKVKHCTIHINCTDGATGQCTKDDLCTQNECTKGDRCTYGPECTKKDGVCTKGAICTSAGECTGGNACTIGPACTTSDYCTNGDCTATQCTSGDGCTGGDTACTKGTNCTNGNQGGCTDGGNCTAGKSCTGGGFCTGGDASSKCTFGFCTNGNKCTAVDEESLCTSGTGCTNQANGCTSVGKCSDGTICTQNACVTKGQCGS